MEKVQVLLSSYNGQEYIRQQLDSILNQKGVLVDCLVRDDGSNDNTINILNEYQEKYSNVKVVFGDNLGYKKSFMKLVQLSGEFDYYAFADQDDVWKEEKLLRAVEQISDINDNIPVMYCSNCSIVDDNLKYIKMLHERDSILPGSKAKAIVQGFAHGCTMVFNSNVKQLISKYKVNQEYAHDFWIPLVVFYLGMIIYDRNSYILYRQHNNNIFGSRKSLLSVIKYRLKQQKNNQMFYSTLSNEIMVGYGEQLELVDYKMLSELVNYKLSLSKKIKLFFNNQLKRDTLKGTLFLKYLILSSKF